MQLELSWNRSEICTAVIMSLVWVTNWSCIPWTHLDPSGSYTHTAIHAVSHVWKLYLQSTKTRTVLQNATAWFCFWKITCWQILKKSIRVSHLKGQGRESTALVSSHQFNGTMWGTWVHLQPSGLQLNQTSFTYLMFKSKYLAGRDGVYLL